MKVYNFCVIKIRNEEIKMEKFRVTVRLNASSVDTFIIAETDNAAMSEIKRLIKNAVWVELLDEYDNINLIKTENICKITVNKF